MKDLNNKNIIVTGASGGIGNSIVSKLNECGANILASGTRLEKLEELKSKFKNLQYCVLDKHNASCAMGEWCNAQIFGDFGRKP